MSLAARTGLLDQDTASCGRRPWIASTHCEFADRRRWSWPAPRSAGQPDPTVPAALHGAVLTIAGHDHPVAAVGCGVTGAHEIFDSFGTAEALVRSVEGNLRPGTRGTGWPRPGSMRCTTCWPGGGCCSAAPRPVCCCAGPWTCSVPAAANGAPNWTGPPAHWPSGTGRRIRRPTEGHLVQGAANNDGTLRIGVDQRRGRPGGRLAGRARPRGGRGRPVSGSDGAEIGPADGASSWPAAGPGWPVGPCGRRPRHCRTCGSRDRSQAGAFGATMFAAHAAIADGMAAFRHR